MSTMSFDRVCKLLSSNEKQDIEEAKRITKNESLYNASDISQNTLLHHACEIGNSEMVQFLVDLGSKVDAWNELGQTPLVSTLETCNPCKEVIDILLKAGAKILDLDNIGKSAVTVVNSGEWLSEDRKRLEIYKMLLEKADYFVFFNLLQDGSEKIIKMLLQTNIDPSMTDSEGNTLVHILAQNPNPGIMELLRDKNIDIDARTNDGWTPLMNAAIYGATSAVEFLLVEGADIEAVDEEKKTALYIAFEDIIDGEDKNCIQLLLEHGANAQIEVESDSCPTIFDLILESRSFSAGKLVLAHLALQEAKEANITQLIYSKINSHNQFKTYFEKCKKQITTKIYRSVTLLDILTASERKLERYLHDKELAARVAAFKTVKYYATILRKRLSKTTSMIELRKVAAPIIGELMKIEYDSYPSIMDEIVSYLEKKDLECLISVQEENPCYQSNENIFDESTG